MPEAVRLLMMLALAGAAVTFAGSGIAWFQNDQRRIRRALKKVLSAEPQNVLSGYGKGVGFDLEKGLAAVAWDGGEWCLVYKASELLGAELIIDGQVAARVYRDEPRRALDQVGAEAARVTLRLVFDDPKHPDFTIDLWIFDPRARNQPPPAETVKVANRWVSGLESLIRRHAPKVAPRPGPPPPPPPTPLFDQGPADETPPWDDDPDELDR
jgi:hypothetical protein